MLALHEGVPTEYRSLVPLLLTPSSWTQKGSIPGLVRLLQAFLARDAAQIVASGQIESVLGIVQQRLIPSKLNDSWGFELLQAVVRYVPPYVCSSGRYSRLAHSAHQDRPSKVLPGCRYDAPDTYAKFEDGLLRLPFCLLLILHTRDPG